MNTGNMSNDEAKSIGNFIEQLNNIDKIKLLEKIIFDSRYNSQFTDVVNKEIAIKSFNLGVQMSADKVKSNSFLSSKILHKASIETLIIK